MTFGRFLDVSYVYVVEDGTSIDDDVMNDGQLLTQVTQKKKTKIGGNILASQQVCRQICLLIYTSFFQCLLIECFAKYIKLLVVSKSNIIIVIAK
jgi:hypothetical protein